MFRNSTVALSCNLKRDLTPLHDLALDLISDGAFQIQGEAKQERSPALFVLRVVEGCAMGQTLPPLHSEDPASL